MPSKKDYRHYNIKSVFGLNDYLSIEEVVKRRYVSLLKNNKDLPNLIIIDGGKGQLTSALRVLNKLKLYNIDLISIAKKNEIIFLKNLKSVVINKKSESLKLIQYLRNEAHRFCLKHHKRKRNKLFLKSELNNINGIGKQTIIKLFKYFKSLYKIKKTSKENLIKIIGIKKAIIIYEHFNK